MRDFVEFNQKGGKKVAVRTGYTQAVRELDDGSVLLDIDDESSFIVAGPYDEVMRKLKEAEEYEHPPVVEHFTRDEYAELLATLDFRTKNDAHWPGELMLIKSKLEKILKGEE